ncbi:MAG: hypothetical protein ACK4N5_06870, partial [Myxococcales bacterium]
MPLTEDDIARRLPVWEALSELFLDTQHDARDKRAIALALRRSGFAEDELARIFDEEVAPVCGPNLMTVAGEWAGFEPAWLRERIVAARSSLRGRASAVLAKVFAAPAIRSARRELNEVFAMMARLREDPSGLVARLSGPVEQACAAAETLRFQAEFANAVEVRAALAQASGAPDADVRCGAVTALAEVAGGAAMPTLLARLDDPEARVRLAALQAVRVAAGRPPLAPQDVDALLRRLPKWLRAPDAATRRVAAGVIER